MKRSLRGALLAAVVLLILAPLATSAVPPETAPVRNWTAEDFGGVLSVGLEGHRNYPAGLTHYRKLCADCHQLGVHGAGSAPDLTRRSLTYTPEELLTHLLSATKHRQHKASQSGLLDSLTQAGVLDLLAFVLSGADPKSPFFFNP